MTRGNWMIGHQVVAFCRMPIVKFDLAARADAVNRTRTAWKPGCSTHVIVDSECFQMSIKATPSLILSMSALVAAAVAIAMIFAALDQPWTGLSLASRDNAVVIVSARGPSNGLPQGAVVESLSSQAHTVRLEPIDVAPEPDGAMGDYGTYRRFLDRQERLSRVLRAETVDVETGDGKIFSINPEPQRPLGSLPVAFWVQLSVGVFAWLIAASVFAYRSADVAAQLLLLSGAATLTFAPFAGVYSTRELALPGTLFQWLNDLNFLGGGLFAACFVALLLNYPRRIGPSWLGLAVVGLFLAWFAAQQIGVFESMTFARRFLVLIGLMVTFGLAGWHWFASRRDPATRAALQWFLLSWVVGTGVFALFILLPQMFGIDTSALQGYAFLLFLLVYGGLAFGILRYRLFDLGRWWTGAIVYLVAALTLIAFDFLFLFVLHLSAEMSLALALLVCGVLWLPLRGLIWSSLFGARDTTTESDRFRQITDVALAPPGTDRQADWQAILSDAFRPLQVETQGEKGVALEQEGLSLRVPGVDGLTGLRLSHADEGRRLFGPRDIDQALHLLDMLTAAAESRQAYEKGVLTERTRIARDIHDNIGAQLLSALHSPTTDRKNLMIGQTLSDLRDIIRNATRPGLPADEALADLRAETAERLAPTEIALEWSVRGNGDAVLSPESAQALRSVVREAVSNIIRHARATKARIDIEHIGNGIRLEIADNGHGFVPSAATSGIGLANMRTRVGSVGGLFEVATAQPGTAIRATVPLGEVRSAAE